MISRDYDTFLFLEIIESIQGILFIRADAFEGIRIRVYQGINGRTVFVDVSDEDIDEATCKAHLTKLGIEYLIEAIFPTLLPAQNEQNAPPTIEAQKN